MKNIELLDGLLKRVLFLPALQQAEWSSRAIQIQHVPSITHYTDSTACSLHSQIWPLHHACYVQVDNPDTTVN